VSSDESIVIQNFFLILGFGSVVTTDYRISNTRPNRVAEPIIGSALQIIWCKSLFKTQIHKKSQIIVL